MREKECGSKCVSTDELKSDMEFVELIKGQSSKLNIDSLSGVRTEVEDLSGNINRVRRVRLLWPDGRERTFVVKHVPANGRLERYPEIVFPESRLAFEAEWFELAEQLRSNNAVTTPHVLHFDKDQRVLIMEDLEPQCSLGEFLRQKQNVAGYLLVRLGQFLERVHSGSSGFASAVANPSAAQNRPFVFTLPLVEPDKMRAIWEGAEKTQSQSELGSSRITLRERIIVQERYLRGPGSQVLPIVAELERTFKQGQRGVLTHGDLHTESVLVLGDERLGVVDAELCDYGCRGFDLGTFCAHLWACRLVAGMNKKDIGRELGHFLAAYANELFEHGNGSLAEAWALYESSIAHCGAELLRRLLGAAGFAFPLTAFQFEELLEDATTFLVKPENHLRSLFEQALV